MKLSRRLACLVLAAGVVPAAAFAQDYPSKPIRLISNYGAGSSIDLIARLVARPLSEQLGQQVIVENKPGAGGDLGTAFVANAPKDGYTIGFAAPGPMVFNPLMRPSMPFAPTDVKPIILPFAQEQIQDRMRDLCLSLDPRDYFDIAEPIVNVIRVDDQTACDALESLQRMLEVK